MSQMIKLMRRALTFWRIVPLSFRRRLMRWGLMGGVILALLPPCMLGLYALIPPPGTPLMLLRLSEGEGWDYRWKPFDGISAQLPAHVIAAEDNLFCQHGGFDLKALENAASGWIDGTSQAGGSTLSQQTAKNLLFWPGRSFLRKGLEAYVTIWMELLWSKQRILTAYLNIAEWGPGIYGAEAASRHYFGVSAAALTPRQAALLAAILPNPRKWSASAPSSYIRKRANTLQQRVGQLGPLLDCAKGR